MGSAWDHLPQAWTPLFDHGLCVILQQLSEAALGVPL